MGNASRGLRRATRRRNYLLGSEKTCGSGDFGLRMGRVPWVARQGKLNKNKAAATRRRSGATMPSVFATGCA